MSAGNFLRANYSADAGTVHPIRIQPETAALVINGVTNAVPAGPIDSPISAKVSGGRRGIGLKARTVTIAFSPTAPTGYETDEPITLPVLQQSVWNGIGKGQTGTYLASPIVVLYKSPERVG